MNQFAILYGARFSIVGPEKPISGLVFIGAQMP
jgi:hypothetical protein